MLVATKLFSCWLRGNDQIWVISNISYGTLSEVNNLQGRRELKEFDDFPLSALALIFSNICERIFSKVNFIKTKQKLQTETIKGLLQTSQDVLTGGG